MAWIFLSDSMLMPSLAPMDKADPKLTLGRRTMQIRGRLTSHLTNFIENYGEGLDFSEVEETPFADYTCRFYATPEAFAEAMKRAMLDIDYRKFKNTAERPRKLTGKIPERAKEYHGVLTSIWSISQRVAPAGGWYGPWSADNPKGYGKARKYTRYGADQSLSQGRDFVGSTFLYDDEDFESARWATNQLQLIEDDSFDYVPEREQRLNDLLEELEEIPTNQWEDYLTAEEFEMVAPFQAKYAKAEKRFQRDIARSRRNSRKQKPVKRQQRGRHRA